MTQLPTDTDRLAAAIDILWPPADDEYARAWRSMHLADLLGELSLRNREQYHQLLEIIRTENLESRRYCIETPYRTTDTVNLPLLRQTLPDLYTRLVYIRASDAEKYLGKQALYKLAKKAAGTRINSVERISLTDLRKNLTADELPQFLTRIQIPGEPVIIELPFGGKPEEQQ